MQTGATDIRFAPPTSSFTFKAPYPPTTGLKQRRVSLAVPPSERVVPAWSFRDDTSVETHVAETDAAALDKAGPLADSPDEMKPPPDPVHPALEKKARKKWTMEETQMLVDGCNKVRGAASAEGVCWMLTRAS